MLETPRISEPHTAPAFGGLLAWLRGCGLAFFLELWYGRALYRQMMATMAILVRMLLAFRVLLRRAFGATLLAPRSWRHALGATLLAPRC